MTPDDLPPRIASQIAVAENGCWIWTGYIKSTGYGSCYYAGRSHNAHRAVYLALVGDVGAGLHLDHVVCQNKRCCNPLHVEPVTPRENTLRWAALITHCPAGHEYTPENTYAPPGRNYRRCRKCHNQRETIRSRERTQRKAAHRAPQVRAA